LLIPVIAGTHDGTTKEPCGLEQAFNSDDIEAYVRIQEQYIFGIKGAVCSVDGGSKA
jgi:hypothetical protein